jgi:hypothetical protein
VQKTSLVAAKVIGCATLIGAKALPPRLPPRVLITVQTNVRLFLQVRTSIPGAVALCLSWNLNYFSTRGPQFQLTKLSSLIGWRGSFAKRRQLKCLFLRGNAAAASCSRHLQGQLNRHDSRRPGRRKPPSIRPFVFLRCRLVVALRCYSQSQRRTPDSCRADWWE